MRKTKLSIGIFAIAFAALTVMSCKDNKKESVDSNGHHTEMGAKENHMGMNNESEEHHHEDGDEDHDHDKGATMKTRDIEASTQKNAATAPIIDAYLQIKNGLVADNKDNAAKGGTALLAAFSNFEMSQLNEEQHTAYMDIVEDAKEHAEHISESPLEHQREHFETLSTDISDLVTLLGTNKTLYLDYCPMKKTNWLSETKEIKNPFFGSKMITCGNVKKKIN
ncbi:hypothetical protein GCM10007962_10940 [Yeosuana aromativorans]|uniref:DUF3347 domain-containing protein n=1 Tax=Yeosuana aromativorans TaxID=288019 RepID=A0A8J3BKY1_9FLAO|nr:MULTISPECIES: DUF3347 domain-containing protein [Yeosuana]GGK18587.1 hypothetical protein GCM10007962_10940 [Yeosuana aromativorans]